jgi:peptidylprolyl isomerase
MNSKLFTSAILSACLPVAAAQTATHKPATSAAVHHSAAVHGGGCVPTPPASAKISELPAGVCVKPLYTLTRKPDVVLDYVSPMVNPQLAKELSPGTITVSLLYADTKVGTGELARPGKWYTVHYTGYLTDGTKFDSSVDRGKPISFPYGQHRVIAGWDTGFEGMHVGGKRRLYVPYQLAYGDNGKPPIPARAELIFDVELIGQHDADPDAKPASAVHPPMPSSRPAPAPSAKPAQSPAGAAGAPPVNPSTPASSTQPATKPESK